MKRPKDMTEAELAALPIGPIRTKFVPFTAEDYTRGAVGKGKTVPIMEDTSLMHFESDDIAMWTDAHGHCWTFGQRGDGSWYKTAL